jgi:hypothetical protein
LLDAVVVIAAEPTPPRAPSVKPARRSAASLRPVAYEAAITPVPDPAGWFHARIEVGRATVKVFVDGPAQPTLTLNRLRTERGRVGLWVDSQEGSFAALTIGGCR